MKKAIIGVNCDFYFKYPQSKVSIGERFSALGNIELLSKGTLDIGSQFCINDYSRIICFHKIIIGDNVTIARFVSILDHDHHFQMNNNKMELDGYDTGTIEIGNNVWIGDKVTILRDVKIGSNVVIAANSVVTKDIPSNVIAGGIPAKVLRELVG